MSSADDDAGRPTGREVDLLHGYTIPRAANDGWLMVESMMLDGDPGLFRGRPIAAFSKSIALMAFLQGA